MFPSDKHEGPHFDVVAFVETASLEKIHRPGDLVVGERLRCEKSSMGTCHHKDAGPALPHGDVPIGDGKIALARVENAAERLFRRLEQAEQGPWRLDRSPREGKINVRVVGIVSAIFLVPWSAAIRNGARSCDMCGLPWRSQSIGERKGILRISLGS